MLSYGYWQRRFGGDPNVIGRTISVDCTDARDRRRDAARIQDSSIYDFDLLLPLRLRSRQTQPSRALAIDGIGRLKPGVTIAQANADVARLINVWMDYLDQRPGTDPHFYLNWKITPAFRP